MDEVFKEESVDEAQTRAQARTNQQIANNALDALQNGRVIKQFQDDWQEVAREADAKAKLKLKKLNKFSKN